MEYVSSLLEGEFLGDREGEFYWLWFSATMTYGVGDIVTTITILKFGEIIGVREGNLLLRQSFESFGENGIIALKLAVFFGCLAISLTAAEELDWGLYYLPPIVLFLLGLVLTVNNLLIFFS